LLVAPLEPPPAGKDVNPAHRLLGFERKLKIDGPDIVNRALIRKVRSEHRVLTVGRKHAAINP
jgi:hypothetical protein